ncbi:hypothetical protein QE364_001214 [Nocardioides zeae]|uniref:Uncharacterized protein n=1 Tax=Nocardioides zeae TaxID=1457234 RepID=A0ACC6IFQ3_9ACTN|nr:DUF429 domain-containing protein [Nocardioides zeae]MDR6176502.1 hypothetical protein [Nocardioides zeae]MDR6209514.1 hypothetical protein [Nocardioides zeae]
MQTAGIDFSADPKKTGVATLLWHGDTAAVTAVRVGEDSDQDLCGLILDVDKTGIDCPLGWPTSFIDYLIAHRQGGRDLLVPKTRRSLSYRVTDIYVMERTGVRPLSVSADRIGAAAMRCAAVLSSLTRRDVAVDRSGRTGPIAEVYPAAALNVWGLPHQGYKGSKPENVQRRIELVRSIELAFPWLELGEHADFCRRSDDALDSVLCGVIAGLVMRGGTEPLPENAMGAAATEGWIALPKCK